MTMTSIIQIIILLFCAVYMFVRWFQTKQKWFYVMSAVSVGIAFSVATITKL